jgi:rod shape-determining protein MreC
MKTLNLIALSVFMAATIAVLTLDTPTTRAVQAKVLAIFAPFIHVSGTVHDTTSQAAAPDVDPRELMRYNEQLKLEVAKLKILSQRHDELLDENNRLREMVGYKMRSPFKQLIAAHVIKRSAAMWWNTLIIDKGSEDGIEPDRAVLTDAGLVGKTGRVTANMAEVVLLTDELCRVSPQRWRERWSRASWRASAPRWRCGQSCTCAF